MRSDKWAGGVESSSVEALRANIKLYDALVRLSGERRAGGNVNNAAELAARAIQAKPEAPAGYVEMGLCYLAVNHDSEALQCFDRAISVHRDCAPAYRERGSVLERMGRLDEAVQSYREAIRLNPGDTRFRLNLGGLLFGQGDLPAARECATAVLNSEPDCANAHLLLSLILDAGGQDEEAFAHVDQALACDPNCTFGHLMRGFRLMRRGEFESAEASFKTAVTLEPVQGQGYFGISQCRQFIEADVGLIAQMDDVRRSGKLNRPETTFLLFGLGKAYDDRGDFGMAMSTFREAHTHAAGPQPFDRGAYTADIDARIGVFSKAFVNSSAEGGCTSELPIFIVGMMRSGTTLVEQIITSHCQVGGAGEAPFWGVRESEVFGGNPVAFDETRARGLALTYCDTLSQSGPTCTRITDKLPANCLRLGLLHRVLPNARIIHVRRSPIDTCLSIYFTFHPNGPGFAHTPDDLVFAYREYERLMEHWRSVLPPDRFVEVEYESLVRNPEPVIRRAVEFVGLEWDTACLYPERNAKRVNTPSLWQVRQRIYTSSVDRWKRYEPWLGAFRDLL